MSPLSGILIVILCGLDFQSPEFYYIRGGNPEIDFEIN
jgi:hypothetical protein